VNQSLQPIVDAVRRPALAAVLVAVALAGMTGIATADRSGGASSSSEVVVKRGDRGDAVRRIQSALGVAADGVFGPQTERAVKRFQRSRGLVVDGVVGPQTRSALGLQPFSSRSVSPGTGVPRILRLIAECESGGDPTAVSAGGRYRGKYQFSMGTWLRMGGEGDPATAPEWIQDRIALRLYRLHGTAPWPNCP
jgi:Transglycosylase-like domain/Putative peptidoglycan binding domain